MKKSASAVFEGDSLAWAEQQFGQCELGDVRRTRRVVQYAARQAERPSSSTNAVCRGDEAAAEGAYRMLRNHQIKPEALEKGPYDLCAGQCAERDVVLAIQDTTTLSIATALGQELGEVGDKKSARGMLVHSTLAVDGNTGEPIGLLDQLRWTRSDDRPGRKTRSTRAYEERESFKWETAMRALSTRTATMGNIIAVCDREADIYDFLQYRIKHGHRFVVRAMQNRSLESEGGRLLEHLAERRVIGKYHVVISQRGAQQSQGQRKRSGRQQRTATMTLRTATLELQPPREDRARDPIVVNVVLATETECPEGSKPLQWVLLTSEQVSTQKGALTVLGYYERRWLIEEFHKAWKSGCRIQQRAVQSVDNLHRVIIITAQVAVRLLQLRSAAIATPEAPCDTILSGDELDCLWATTERRKRPPAHTPTVLWALHAIGKLAGWRDTKRTGRVGWQMLWNGWATLEAQVTGWKLARNTTS